MTLLDQFNEVEKAVFADSASQDPEHCANELDIEWTKSLAQMWDMKYERCSECEHWCECGELADEDGNTTPCSQCR